MHRSLHVIGAALALMAATSVVADETVLRVAASVPAGVLEPGSAAEVAIGVKLEGAWHVNAAKPADPMLIPTKLTLEPVAGVSFGGPVYPKAKEMKFEFSDEPLLVYEGAFSIRVPLLVDAEAAVGAREVRGKLHYQACDNERCLAPRDEAVSFQLQIGAADAGPSDGTDEKVAPKTGAAAATPPPPLDQPGALERVATWGTSAFDAGSYGVAMGLFFVVGLLLSFTPCVYPVIPITMGFFAGQSHGSRRRKYLLAAMYLLAMAGMYASLGAVAAVFGKTFGAVLGSPVVLVFLSLVMVALALSMFDVWQIGIPSFLAERLAASPSGLAGAAFMGLTVGVVAAPCIGPGIVPILALVAKIGSIPVGIAIFFSLSLGLGTPLVLIAIGMQTLPRAGEWMTWVKHLFGFVLLGMALYFLRPLLGDPVFAWGIPILAVAAALFLGFFDREGRSSPGFRKVRWVSAALLLVGAVVSYTSLRPRESKIAWRAYEASALAASLGAGKPVLVDFTAAWCIPCKELERFTFSDDGVARQAARFVAFKADGTVAGDGAVEALMTRYGVRGFPAILFIDSHGAEQEELRVVGFVNAEDLRARLERID